MSTEENVHAVEAIFDAFRRGDIPYILDQLTDDVHFVAHLDPSVPWSGDYSGKADVPGFFQAIGSSVDVTGHPSTSSSLRVTRSSRLAKSASLCAAPARLPPARGCTSGSCAMARSTATTSSTIPG